MNVASIIGWASSVVLVITLARQVWKQWEDRTSKGVSPWLFGGQIAASVGFTIYSAILGDALFIVTNATLLFTASVGLAILMRHRRGAQRVTAASTDTPLRRGSDRSSGSRP